MQSFVLLLLGGGAWTGFLPVHGQFSQQGYGYCLTSADCEATHYCRQVSLGQTQRQCYLRASLGSRCSYANTGDPSTQVECAAPYTCTPVDPNNVAVGAVCQTQGAVMYGGGYGAGAGCRYDEDCGPQLFCRSAPPPSTTRTCVQESTFMAPCTMDGTVPAYSEQRCTGSLQCIPNNINQLSYGGACKQSQSLDGVTCQSNTNCGSSFFCRRVNMYTSVKECYPRKVDGQPCSLDCVPDYQEAQCLSSLVCVGGATSNVNSSPSSSISPNFSNTQGTCRTRQGCFSDLDCGQNAFCKREGAGNSWCESRAGPGQFCTMTGVAPEHQQQVCMPSLQCVPVEVANPGLGGTCQHITTTSTGEVFAGSCVSDLDCGYNFYCKQASYYSTGRICAPLGAVGTFCTVEEFVPAWEKALCQPDLLCGLYNQAQPQQGGRCEPHLGSCTHCGEVGDLICSNGVEYKNSCWAACAGAIHWEEGPCGPTGCKSDQDCGSNSLYCRRVNYEASLNNCFVKATENEKCTFSHVVNEWDHIPCLSVYSCEPLDVYNLAAGGICRSFAGQCNDNYDCPYDQQCRKAALSSTYATCTVRSSYGQDCLEAPSLSQIQSISCMNGLYCFPNDISDPYIGGTCKGSDRCYQCPNNLQPVCAYTTNPPQEYRNSCFYNCAEGGSSGGYQNGHCPTLGAYPQTPYPPPFQPQQPGQQPQQPQPQTPPNNNNPPPPSRTGTCQGRCFEAYSSGAQCYCDNDCKRKNDCCSDFEHYCLYEGQHTSSSSASSSWSSSSSPSNPFQSSYDSLNQPYTPHVSYVGASYNGNNNYNPSYSNSYNQNGYNSYNNNQNGFNSYNQNGFFGPPNANPNYYRQSALTSATRVVVPIPTTATFYRG